jgi:hypothetical protein
MIGGNERSPRDEQRLLNDLRISHVFYTLFVSFSLLKTHTHKDRTQENRTLVIHT